MYKLKALIPHSRPWQRLYSLSFGRKATTYAQPAYTRSNEIQEVAVKGLAIARIAILNRPSALNAITSPMVDRLSHLYNSWEENKDLGFVVIKGAGRAFCAGSDVVSLYELLNNGEVEEYKAFFQSLYKFIYNLGTYMKPQVAILDGITMGIGAGISVPGLFRVVTDKTVFAMPEVQVGFHPDAGASFYLSRLPGYLGEYLALTGEKLNGVEMIACGLATHYVLNARLDWIEERLSKLMSDDHSVIDSSLSQYGDLVYPDKNSVLHRMETIDKCFCLDSIEEIMDALGKEAADSDDPWFSAVLNKLKEASPLSLKVTLNSVREGRFQTLAQCLAREYRISVNFIRKRVSNDFCEGVRARLVDKDFSPQWNPPSVEAVSADMVDCHFEALDDEPELELPVDIREPYF